MGNKPLLDKRTETTGLIISVVFLLVYCSYLFFFRSALLQLEGSNGSILKPEPGQIVAVGFIVLIYHLSYLGLYAFSAFGKAQQTVSSILALLLNFTLLYAFKIWFDAISSNPFLSNTAQTLPWYAKEQDKFLLVNGPLLFFIIAVFVLRFVAIRKRVF